MMKKKSTLILSFCLILFLTVQMGQPMVAYALSDGAYIVSVEYSYLNPEDSSASSSNEALGESMIGSMLEKTALVEQVGSKTYVTIGLGLMSNVSNVRIMSQTKSGGSYKNATIKKTGSSTRNGDTVNHYRLEVTDTDYYIKPVLFIDPMGRDVEFYIQLKMSTAKKGTGIYTSEMVSSNDSVNGPTQTKEPTETKKPSSTKAPTSTKAPAKTTTPSKTEAPANTQTPDKTKEPSKTEAPAKTTAPTVTEAPAKTTAPTVTVAPTVTPATTDVATEEGEITGTTAPTVEPEKTETPVENAVESNQESSLLWPVICILVFLGGTIGLVVVMKRGK